MSPLKHIEDGIHGGDWESVCKGYELLTGKWIAPPDITIVREKISPQDFESAILHISDIISETLILPEKILKSKKRGRPKGSKRKKKVTVTKDGEDSSLQLDESKKAVIPRNPKAGDTQLITNDPDPEEVKRNQIKAKKANRNKAKLNRTATKKHMVKCNECPKTFESDRKGGEMGQKCPDCLNEKKSRFS